jgi:hypothetical protein
MPASHLEAIPCRHIPLNEAGETIDSFYHRHTQIELGEALDAWLRKTMNNSNREPLHFSAVLGAAPARN